MAETGEKLYLRPVCEEDSELLFLWANDEDTRRNSFHTHQITREEHERWFAGMRENPDVSLFVLMADEEPTGQIRIDMKSKTAEISYSIDPSRRGCGYGKKAIRLAVKKITSEYLSANRIIARVKHGNTASMKCFFGNGFTEKECDEYIEYEYIIPEKKGRNA